MEIRTTARRLADSKHMFEWGKTALRVTQPRSTMVVDLADEGHAIIETPATRKE
ncbi:hypothetical protein PCAR4_1530003 [Paraburkholderia caribensis]|nr:hypothetical protein PCAR4_1530003 [Paraburkholderia caribensis]